MKRLDAVDNCDVRPQRLQFFEHQLQIRLSQQPQVTLFRGKALPAQLDLLGGLLSTDVEHRPVAGDGRRALQQQRAFADPGIPTHQHQGPRNQPSPQDAIQFLIAAADALKGLITERRHRGGTPRFGNSSRIST